MIKAVLAAGLLLVSLTLSAADTLLQLDQGAQRYQVSTGKPFEDVVMDIEFMIQQHNYRLTGRNNVGHAIAEELQKDYPEAQVIHFCSIQRARQIIERNPDFIFHMPCKIAVHEDGKQVIIEAQLIPENDPAMASLAKEINAMMRDIADYAAE